VRRFAMMVLSLSMLLGLTGAHRLFAQDKKAEPKKDVPKVEAPKEAPKAEAPKEAPKAEAPLPPIPPEVQKKIDAAWKAIAEAVVAAEDAGLVKTSIKPAPILDILITGRATDEAALKARTGVSPEVFGAWFTSYGQTTGITPQQDVRIIQPSAGLKNWYDQRASLLNREIDAIRKAKAPVPAPAAAPAPAPAPAPKPEAKKAEPKKEEPKKAEPKKEEPKK
jgi:hypothetical protein